MNVLQNKDLIKTIEKLFHITIENNGYPSGICFLCYDTVKSMWLYNQRVEETQEEIVKIAKAVEPYNTPGKSTEKLQDHNYTETNNDNNETNLLEVKLQKLPCDIFM